MQKPPTKTNNPTTTNQPPYLYNSINVIIYIYKHTYIQLYIYIQMNPESKHIQTNTTLVSRWSRAATFCVFCFFGLYLILFYTLTDSFVCFAFYLHIVDQCIHPLSDSVYIYQLIGFLAKLLPQHIFPFWSNPAIQQTHTHTYMIKLNSITN